MFFATLQAKVIVGITIILLLVGAGTAYYYKDVQLVKAQAKNAVEEVVNKTLTNTVKTDIAVAAATNKVNTDLVVNSAKVNTLHAKIATKIDSQIKIIEDTYNSAHGLKKPKQTVEEQDQISSVIITGIWKQYCATDSDNITCNTIK